MSEPNAGTAIYATGTVTLILTQLGIDPLALAWGFAGGLVGQIGADNNTKAKVAALVLGGALTAGALSSLLVYYVQFQLVDSPLIALKVFVSFVIGVTWRHVVEALRSGVPRILEWLVNLRRGESK